MNKLRPGMLALVHGLTQDPEYNGTCVELVEFVVPGQKFLVPGYHYVHRINDTPHSWWTCTGPQLLAISAYEPIPWGLFLPKNLMPLEDPDADFEDGRMVYGARESIMMSYMKRSIHATK